MNNFFKKENLYLRTLIGFLIGIVIGLLYPNFSISTKIIGDIYLSLIKMLITPIVFCSVYCSITSLKDIKKLKTLGFNSIILFIIFFILCCVVSLLINNFINPISNCTLSTDWNGNLANVSISSFLQKIVSSNILQSFVSGDLFTIILFSILFGIASIFYRKSIETDLIVIKAVEELRDILYKVFNYFMEFSPLGVMSLLAYTIATYGSIIFNEVIYYILVCWLCCIACFIFILTIPTLLYTKISLKAFLKACGKVSIVSLSTTSSVATLPTTIQTCIEDLNCKKDIVNFVAPLGSTIHMCGGACSFMCLMVFVAKINNVSLSFNILIFGILIATLMNMAAPGIPGGGIILGATFLSIIGLPLEFIGIYAGIYKLLDMAYTTMNVLGDVSANVILNKRFTYL